MKNVAALLATIPVAHRLIEDGYGLLPACQNVSVGDLVLVYEVGTGQRVGNLFDREIIRLGRLEPGLVEPIEHAVEHIVLIKAVDSGGVQEEAVTFYAETTEVIPSLHQVVESCVCGNLLEHFCP